MTIIGDACQKHTELSPFNYNDFVTQKFKRENFIKNWIRTSVGNTQKVDSIMKEIKEKLYSDLKGADIEDSYYELLAELKARDLI